MVKPNIDLKELAHQIVDDQNGEITSLVLLTTTASGTGCTAIMGSLSDIAVSIARAMDANPQFKELFESAWSAVTKNQIGLN